MTTRSALTLLLACFAIHAYAQPATVQDGFEGNGTITTWYGDDCGINTSFPNPFPQGINTSGTVLRYDDYGGQYANVGFDVADNFDLSENHTFSLKIYLPADGLSGNQPNQVSLKLQDGTLGAPWSTQSEIIKPIQLDQWQTVQFDFADDDYINLDPSSPAPTQRTDFNRVLIQVNGENNNDLVRAYIDDVYYDGTIPTGPVFDNLIWSDEFDGQGAINPNKWFAQTLLPLGDSWFNGEIQHYTDRPENAYVENGVLKIVARQEVFTDQGHTKNFTSARLNSKFAFQYGRVEVRAKLPTGPGTWPAIWMLGKNIDEDGAYWDNQGFGTTPWPDCGEIDIMEHWGTNQDYVSSATHTPSSFGGTVNVGSQFLPGASTEFHVYSLEWTEEEMVFAVDGTEHFTYNPPEKNAATWPFDAEQYLLLNVAILPSILPEFDSSALEIDYVRVYQSSPVSSTAEVADDSAPNVFPNPFRHRLQVDWPAASGQRVQARLYDLRGQLLRSAETVMDQGQLQLEKLGGLPPGLYVLEIRSGDKQWRVKVVKGQALACCRRIRLNRYVF